MPQVGGLSSAAVYIMQYQNLWANSNQSSVSAGGEKGDGKVKRLFLTHATYLLSYSNIFPSVLVLRMLYSKKKPGLSSEYHCYGSIAMRHWKSPDGGFAGGILVGRELQVLILRTLCWISTPLSLFSSFLPFSIFQISISSCQHHWWRSLGVTVVAPSLYLLPPISLQVLRIPLLSISPLPLHSYHLSGGPIVCYRWVFTGSGLLFF